MTLKYTLLALRINRPEYQLMYDISNQDAEKEKRRKNVFYPDKIIIIIIVKVQLETWNIDFS